MKITYCVITIFIAALVGTAIGELCLMFTPEGSFLYRFLDASISPSFRVDKLDLIVISMNFGVLININVVTLAGIVSGSLLCLKKL